MFDSDPAPGPFTPPTRLVGKREGYAFRPGALGTGYYADVAAEPDEEQDVVVERQACLQKARRRLEG